MKILELELQDFRLFYGKHSISFESSESPVTTICSAGNGLGKTTIVNAIRWCIDGSFTSDFFRPEELINYRARNEGSRECTVKLKFFYNGKTYKLIRRLKKISSVTVELIRDSNGDLGKFEGEASLSEISGLMQTKFLSSIFHSESSLYLGAWNWKGWFSDFIEQPYSPERLEFIQSSSTDNLRQLMHSKVASPLSKFSGKIDSSSQLTLSLLNNGEILIRSEDGEDLTYLFHAHSETVIVYLALLEALQSTLGHQPPLIIDSLFQSVDLSMTADAYDFIKNMDRQVIVFDSSSVLDKLNINTNYIIAADYKHRDSSVIIPL
jgi:hypothetical protein